jgi:hypothetical protein
MRKLLAASLIAVLLGFGNATKAAEPTVWRTSAPLTEPGQPAPAVNGKVPEARIARAACPCAASAPCAACTSYAAPHSCHHSHGCGHTCCLNSLCDWLSYRALPVPRECKCHRTCTSCTPPLYSYFAVRYASAYHGYPHGPETGHPVATVPANMPYVVVPSLSTSSAIPSQPTLR